jgi:hypothetical protein
MVHRDVIQTRYWQTRFWPGLAMSLALTLGVSKASAMVERWTVEHGQIDSGGSGGAVAVIDAPSGDTLKVYRDAQARLHLSIRLRDGFEKLDVTVCPTLQIDTDQPWIHDGDKSACVTDSRGARMVLGAVESSSLKSPLVHKLMTGTTVMFRLRLTGLGYREVLFSLRGSMQALVEVMGPGVEVTGDSP